MIVTNSKDVEEQNKGMQDVSFVFMVIDDTLQDERAGMCAKADIYSNHLGEQIEKDKWAVMCAKVDIYSNHLGEQIEKV
jgi:hypothetical protein